MHEGYAVKESGAATFGKKNWRKRWFRLVQREQMYYLEYYRFFSVNYNNYFIGCTHQWRSTFFLSISPHVKWADNMYLAPYDTSCRAIDVVLPMKN